MTTVPPRATVLPTISARASAGSRLVVPAVAVGRFDQQIVGALDRYRIDHDGVVVSAEVAGEDGRDAGPVELDRGGAEDMAGPAEPHVAARRQIPLLIERDRRQMLERRARILECVERQRRLVLGEAMAVGEFRVLLLQMPGVGQQDRAEVGGRLRAVDGPSEAALDQQRQISRSGRDGHG